MKNIEIFMGSPRKNGNTSSLTNNFISRFKGLEGFNLSTSYLYDLEIKPCIDCRACKQNNLVCAVKDDMQSIYKKLENTDIIIFATPIYWFAPTAVTKALIDRLRPYYGNKRLAGKKAAVILVAGVGEKDCDLTIQGFERIFASLGIEFLGYVTSKAYDIGESEKDKKAMRSVELLSNAIING